MSVNTPATPPSGRSRSISLTARRSPKFLAKPAVRIEAMCLPSQLALRATRCGGLWHRRCRRAGPGPGGAQDEGQEQHFEHDAEAVEVYPGLADHVERRDGDVERRHDEVERAVRTGGQCHGEQDHEARDPHEHERNDYEGLTDVELEDDAGQDVVDDAGLVQVEVVDVDVEEHEARPGGRELRSDRYRRIVQCCRGLGVCAQGSLHRVEGGCAWIGPHRPSFIIYLLYSNGIDQVHSLNRTWIKLLTPPCRYDSPRVGVRSCVVATRFPNLTAKNVRNFRAAALRLPRNQTIPSHPNHTISPSLKPLPSTSRAG